MINPIRHYQVANSLFKNLTSLRQLQVKSASSPTSFFRFLNLSSVKFAESASSAQESKTSPVLISDSCLKRLREIKESSPNKLLRVTVDSGGCSGFEYKFSLDPYVAKEDDVLIEREDCKIVLDNQSVDYLRGSTVDYFEELIRAGFRITNNPNSEHNCSCGSSFSVKL